ncbi:MAG: hypothetical protein WCQ95_14095 [Bacteroidota bacterium]
MDNKISGEITPTNITNLEAVTGIVDTELPFLHTATKSERKSIRKMSTRNTGYVEKVYSGSLAHSDALPATFDLAGYTKDVNLKAKLPYIKQIFKTIVERLEDTELLLGHDLMKQSDYCYAQLKLAAKDNDAVKEIVGEIAAGLKGMGSRKNATVFGISAGNSITVYKVVTGTFLVNKGTTVLKIKAGSELASKVRAMESLIIEPGNSAVIYKTWTIIEVSNLSNNAEGSFSVKIKK